ncbi:MAG: nucleoside monophosphate kinase, partial [Planctomycetota bacterium]
CQKGSLLDGFPRNSSQAENLLASLSTRKIQLGYLIEIKLDRAIAKARLIGRRVCQKDPNHPNNLNIPELQPVEKNKTFFCRVCQSALTTRADDIDEKAIDKRHDIYYDTKNGTLAAIFWMKSKLKSTPCKMIELDGAPSVEKVTQQLEKVLK